MLSFKRFEIQLLNVRLYRYSTLISLHFSLCLHSAICWGVFWPSCSCFAPGSGMDSILQRNTPFKKQNGTCPCYCSAAEIYPVPYHHLLSKWTFRVNGHAGRKHIIPVQKICYVLKALDSSVAVSQTECLLPVKLLIQDGYCNLQRGFWS